ncbi:MAG: hypothetical protein DHS20C12_14010 [Pseudohongiella sp.]|nr:MAG: hypothetical protein DHS20C12_14010 [Pseudohongiella sp.]
MNSEVFVIAIPTIVLFGVFPAIIFYFIHRVKAKKLDTIVKVVELGGVIDPEMMKMLSDRAATSKTDYKYGLIWLAIGLPLVAGIWLQSGFSEAIFGSIPTLIGIAYLISGKYQLRETD